MNWDSWTLQRVLFLITGLAFIGTAIQVTLFHYRQNFRHWAMWLPVIATPILGVLALLICFYNSAALRTIWAVLLSVAAVVGLGGFTLHFVGVGERVDGYKLNNFLIGPPVMLPLMVTATSLLGLIALYWRW